MIDLDPETVSAAQRGSRAALESIVRQLQRPLFNLAIRMLGNAADAEDAAQEVLILVITHLGEVRAAPAAASWVFRIACRYLVHARKKGRLEAQRLTFRAFAADLEAGLEELPAHATADPETAALIEEVKIGCTLALLTCLTRQLRAAYVLGEIFELTDAEAAFALEIAPAAYRQRLRRARALVTSFLQAKCGIVSADAACRCHRRVGQALRLGRIARGHPAFGDSTPLKPRVADVQASVAKLDRGRAVAALLRSNPNFTTNVGELALQVLDRDGL